MFSEVLKGQQLLELNLLVELKHAYMTYEIIQLTHQNLKQHSKEW